MLPHRRLRGSLARPFHMCMRYDSRLDLVEYATDALPQFIDAAHLLTSRPSLRPFVCLAT